MRVRRVFRFPFIALLLAFLAFAATGTRSAFAQTGNSGSISGAVTDPSGAAIPGATVQIQNPVSGLNRSTTTDATGNFSFPNVPFNPYHLTVQGNGFSP